MQLFMSVFAAILFFVLTPGVLLSLPPSGSKITVAATHALVFGIVFHLTKNLLWKLLYNNRQGFEDEDFEGFEDEDFEDDD